MFPTTCVTSSHTSLSPPTRKCVSGLFPGNVVPGFVLPVQGPLKLLCRGSAGTHTHTGTQGHRHGTAGGTGSGSCTLHWCPAPVTGITRRGHQGLSPSKPFKSCCVLASKLQLTEGDSPLPRTACVGTEESPCSGINLLCARGWGQFPGPLSLRKDICPWLLLSLLPAHPHCRGK